MDRWEHARAMTELLAGSLGALELRMGSAAAACHGPALRAAIAAAWQRVVTDAQAGSVSLSSEYLSALHRTLAGLAGARAPGAFSDGKAPTSWSTFVREVGGDLPAEQGDPAHVLAQLAWGNHFCSLALALGWLVQNGLRLQDGCWAIYPPPADHDRLIRYLLGAGPDTYDAESLRSLLPSYEIAQRSP